MEISYSTKFPTLAPNQTQFSLLFPHSNRTQIQEPIICARNRKTRPGSGRSTVLMLKSAYLIASKLRIIPEPLDLAIREFSGGAGAGAGGNGGGFGFGWSGFDGGRRRRKKKLGLFCVLIAGFLLCLWLCLGKEIDSELFRGILGLSLFGVSVNGWKLGFIDWVLGFCGAFFISLGIINREHMKIWVKGFFDMEIFRGRKKRGIWRWRS